MVDGITTTVFLFCLFFCWGGGCRAVISMVYYGLSLNVSNLTGGLRLNFLLSCVVELVGYIVALFLMDYLGRKKLHSASMLTAGISCLLTIFTILFAGQGEPHILIPFLSLFFYLLSLLSLFLSSFNFFLFLSIFS